MNDILWELLINLIEAVIYSYFICSIINEKKAKKSQAIILIFSLFIITTIKTFFNFSNIFSIISIILIGTLCSYSTLKCSISKSFTANVMFILCTILSETFLMLLPSLTNQVSTLQLLTSGSTRYIFTFLYLITLYVVLSTIIHIRQRLIFNRKDSLLFLLLCFIEITVSELSLITLVDIDTADTINNKNLFIITLLSLIGIIFMSFFIINLGIARYNNIKLLKEESEKKAQELELKLLSESTKDLRILKHDLTDHLNIIKELIKNNKFNELNDYIASYENDISKITYLVSTGNTVIDYIVTSKIKAARRYNINVNHNIFMPKKLNIENVHLSAIITNIFNNAIEACNNLDITFSEKYIDLDIHTSGQMLIINMKNPHNHLFNTNDVNMLTIPTSKPDNIYSGLGLQRIRQILDLYQGFMNISTNDNIFSISIFIPVDNN